MFPPYHIPLRVDMVLVAANRWLFWCFGLLFWRPQTPTSTRTPSPPITCASLSVSQPLQLHIYTSIGTTHLALPRWICPALGFDLEFHLPPAMVSYQSFGRLVCSSSTSSSLLQLMLCAHLRHLYDLCRRVLHRHDLRCHSVYRVQGPPCSSVLFRGLIFNLVAKYISMLLSKTNVWNLEITHVNNACLFASTKIVHLVNIFYLSFVSVFDSTG